MKVIRLTPTQAQNWNPQRIRAFLEGNTAVKPVEFTATDSDIDQLKNEVNTLKEEMTEIKKELGNLKETPKKIQ